MSDSRASIFGNDEENNKLDLAEFSPRKAALPVVKDVAKAVAKESSFLSREANADAVPSQTKSLRKKVVREDQLSARIQRKHYELFYNIVNETNKKNAEVIELAIEALARDIGLAEE